VNMQRYNDNLPAVMNQGGAIGTMPEQRPMTIEEFDQRLELIKHVVTEMVQGTHYGVIPGTHDNSLWEPGAEYLRAAFNIQWGYDVIQEHEDFATHDYYYRFFVFQLLGPGVRGAGWEASAWSRERKFWCKGGRDGCPRDCDGQAHGPLGMEAQMLPHNVRDRALKRGFVAMIRNVTGTTGWFKQALDADPDQLDADEPIGDGTDHPLLQMCPTHNRQWIKTKKMPAPGHPSEVKGGQFCNQAAVLKPILDKMLAEIMEDSWTVDEAKVYLKEHFDGTWNSLSPKRKLEAIGAMQSTPPPGSQTPEEPEAPANADPDAGDIQTPMEGETKT